MQPPRDQVQLLLLFLLGDNHGFHACPADAANDHNALMKRFEGVTAELSRVKDGAADMRLRLEHFTGPAGPNARIRQLEASLQTVSMWVQHLPC